MGGQSKGSLGGGSGARGVSSMVGREIQSPRELRFGVMLISKEGLLGGPRAGADRPPRGPLTSLRRSQTCPRIGREGPSPRELRIEDMGVSGAELPFKSSEHGGTVEGQPQRGFLGVRLLLGLLQSLACDVGVRYEERGVCGAGAVEGSFLGLGMGWWTLPLDACRGNPPNVESGSVPMRTASRGLKIPP